jgi:hypothetical protein
MKSKRAAKRLVSFIFLFLSLVYPPHALPRQSNTKSNAERDLKTAKSDLHQAALEHRNSLEKLLVGQQADVRAAAETYRSKRQLYDESKIERRELDASRRVLEESEAAVIRTKREIQAIEAEYHLLPLQATSPVEAAKEIELELKVISLDAKDKEFVRDAINELTRLTYTMAVTSRRHKSAFDDAKKIMLTYCKCTMSQYDDYLEGKGLPSVVNQMDHGSAKMSNKDALLSRYLTNKMEALVSYQKSQRELYDSTVAMTVTRLADSFARQGGRYIEGYVFNVDQMKFVPLVNRQQAKPLDVVIRDYIGTHIENLSKEETSRIIDSVIRQEQEREGITPKPQRSQGKKPARKTSPKPKTSAQSI